jgi:hypothetical protein
MLTQAQADKQGAREIKEVASVSKQAKGSGREGARMVGALEAAWEAIRAAHPDVPQVVLVVASGGRQTRSGWLKWGHYAHGRWARKGQEDSQLPEVLVGGEGMQRDAADVFETLLHEAAHAVAAVRKVQDTSRNGRYHNKHFKALAEELGLEVSKQGSRGWATTTLSEQAAKKWHGTIGALGKALQTFRFGEGAGAKKPGSRMLLVTCGCKTKIRLTRSAYEAAPIYCGACDQKFKLK